MVTFFVITYIVTWGAFIAAAMTPAVVPRGLLLFIGIFAPGFVALWLTGRATGRTGVNALLRRLFDWQVPARWYGFAVSYMVVVKLTVALVHRAAIGAWPRFGQEPWYLMLAGDGRVHAGGGAGRRGDRMARVCLAAARRAFRSRGRERVARRTVGGLAPSLVLLSRCRHRWPIVPVVLAPSHGHVGGDGLALREYAG
jgi:hypothetical protein